MEYKPWKSNEHVSTYRAEYEGSRTYLDSGARWRSEHVKYESVKSGKANHSAIALSGHKRNLDSVEKGSFLHLFAGGVAGCASTLVTCPIDVIKTRQQSSGTVTSSAAKIASKCRTPKPRAQSVVRNLLRAHFTAAVHPGVGPSTMLQHGRYIVNVEGLRSFYKGLGPSLIGVVPSRALFFGAYDYAKKSLQRDLGFRRGAPSTHILASTLGGLVCTTATCPLWVMKTKQQLHRRMNKTSLSLGECVRRVWAREGFKGFYRGLTASYAGIAETVIYFTIYEQLKALYVRKHQLDPSVASVSMSTFWELPGLMLISSVSKCSATCVAYPHEVVRTRLREEPVKQKYSGFFQTLRCITAREGMRGLYGGLPAQLIRQVPNMAILMGVYEGVVYMARS